MELLRRNNRPVPTAQEIVDGFRDKVPDWDTRPGLARGPEMHTLIFGLKIADSARGSRAPDEIIATSSDPNLVGILGFAEKFPAPGGGFSGHCVIIIPHKTHFDLWSPLQDGRSQVIEDFPWATMADFKMIAVMLFKPPVLPLAQLSEPLLP
jgi:hypothetical protein